MPEELDQPSSVAALYIERGAPVEPWRPVMTGDVFEGIEIPGVGAHPLTMIISHPCTMRQAGGQLRERLQALPVREHQVISLEQWVDGYRKIFPLPELDDGAFFAARLDEFGMVPASEFDCTKRRGCLSEDGIAMLLQRFFACMARVKVRLETIKEELIGPMNEAELLEEWAEELARTRVDAGTDLAEALSKEAREFDGFLTAGDGGLQQALKDPVTAVSVRRTVRKEIHRRAA